MKFDIVMWAFNGGRFLPSVLRRVESAIPEEYVHRKILVDDHSVDNTVKIARDFNWEVYSNPSTGISSGANEALRHVDCKHFMSIEQDVILSKDWIKKIPRYMEQKDVAAAQGIRIATEPTLRKIDAYAYRKAEYANFGFSLDNNLFETRLIKEVGGFPSDCPVCTDGILNHKLRKMGYKWIVDISVVSDHIKLSLKDSYTNQYKLIGKCAMSSMCKNRDSLKTMLRVFATSPARSAAVAIQTKSLKVLWVYPKFRFHGARAMARRLKQGS